MFLAFKLKDIITIPFGYLLDFLYQFTTNYGVALILFAVIVRLVLLPINAKSRKSMMKMTRLQPRLNAIKEKIICVRGNCDAEVDGMLQYDPVNEVFNGTYSNNILNVSHNHRAGVNLSYQLKKFRAQLGAAVNPTQTYNKTNGEEYSNKVINWSPQAMLYYAPNENLNVRMFYFGRSAQPSTSQLMPVPDNSNPLNISLGNPYLEPYFNHNVRMYR